jgi:hypothetical protein
MADLKLNAKEAEERNGLFIQQAKVALAGKETQLAEVMEQMLRMRAEMQGAKGLLAEERARMRRELDACVAELEQLKKPTGLHSDGVRRLERVLGTLAKIMSSVRSPLMTSLHGELQAAMQEVLQSEAEKAAAQKAAEAAQNRLFGRNGEMALMAATYAQALQKAKERH